MNEPHRTPDAFDFPVRVYYEDTDAAGVVYYANYFRFFERCRTEWLRALGQEQSRLAEEHGLAFVVRGASAEYHRPARLDDSLIIRLRIEELGRARVRFRQEALRNDGEMLVRGHVEVVCVNLSAMKAVAIPGWLRKELESRS
ncbi:MAG: tol-pal system-associated acyl-CoA thioesterase [Zoogloeaceae bacterium]|jgi:acyl-CoA thioester hydrolase|nr:tol-pal system-associated acyl-CoA thioesterase [Zoogloeaceae bacterium]